MASGLNRQEVVGNLADKAELRKVGEKETAKCSFRVIANTGYGDYEHTEGFNVVVWGKRAEGLAPYLTKGKRVYVAGETRTRSWEDDEGVKHYRTEIAVPPGGDVILLGGGADVSPGNDAPEAPPAPPQEDIPF